MKSIITLLVALLFINVLTAQNVGIGTTTPVNKLSVVGTVNITDSLGIGTANPAGQLHIKSTNTSASIIDQQQINSGGDGNSYNSVNWQSFTAGITGLLIKVDLLVGSPIGGASPGTIKIFSGEGNGGALLSTTSVTFQSGPNTFKSFQLSSFPALVTGNVYTVEFSAPSVIFPWVDRAGGNPYSGGRADVAPSVDYCFKTYVSQLGNVDALLVNDGKVKIATLQIPNGASNNFVLKSDASGNARWANNDAIIETDPKVGTLTGNKIPKWNGSTLADGLVFDNGTNVGIGTVSPSNKLSVVGNSDITGNLGIGSVSPSNKLSVVGNSDITGNLGIGTISASNKLSVVGNSDITGNLGIGTTTPVNKLSVVGTVNITDSLGIGTANPAGQLHVKSINTSASILDQQQINTPERSGSDVNWQSFTAGITGFLTKVDLLVSSPLGGSPSPGTIKIFSGEGNGGTLLSTTSVTFQPVPNTFQSFQLSSFPALVAGNVYTVEFSAPSFGALWVYLDPSNSYSGGRADYNASWDYCFKTYVISQLDNVDALLVNDGKVKIATLQIPNGASDNFVLKSDANGNARWANADTLTVPETDPKVGTLTSNKIPKWNGSTLADGLVFDNGTNVGIGTTNPLSKLHLANSGDVELYLESVGTRKWSLQSNASGAGVNTTFQIIDRNLDASRFGIDNSGNIGIGTTTPTQKLDVAGTTKTTDLLVTGNTSLTNLQITNGANNGYILKTDASGNASWANVNTLNVTETDPKVGTLTSNKIPKWNGTTLADGLVFDNGTNVGIGTVSPSNKLSVVGNSDISGNLTIIKPLGFGITALSGNSSNTSIGIGRSSVEGSLNIAGVANEFATGTSAGDIVVRTESSTQRLILNSGSGAAALTVYNGNVGVGTISPNNKFSVAGNSDITGNLGIGTLTPTQKLDVAGTTKTTNLQVTGNTSLNNLQITNGAGINKVLQSDATGNASWVNANTLTITETDPKVGTLTSNKIPKWNGTTLADGLVFDNGTNVGIGTVSPSNKLSVVGNSDISGNLGIGTTTPVNKLSVNGKVNITDSLGIGTVSPSNKLSVVGNSDITGNLGIGTTTPVNKLSVNGKVNITDSLGIGTVSPSNKLSVVGNSDITGNLGIGTTTPTQKLDVNGITKTSGLQTTNLQITNGAGINKVLQSDATGNASWVNANTLTITETDPKIGTLTSNKIPKWNGTTLTDGLVFDNGTNVGIGTITPSNKLSVSGNSDISGTLGIGTTTPIQTLDVNGRLRIANGVIQNGTTAITGTADLGLYSQVANTWMRFVTNNGRMQFFTENGGGGIGTIPKMVLDESGNLGIGTAAPAATLDVNGSIKTKYSGSNVINVTVGVTTPYQVTIPTLPTGWDYTNTVVLLSAADGAAGNVQKVTLTSLTNIDVYYQAITTGAVRFNWIIFKM